MAQIAYALAITLLLIVVCTAQSPESSFVVELPDEDRKILDQYLGPDVVGKAVEAKPFEQLGRARRFTVGGGWQYRVTSGPQAGAISRDRIVPLKREGSDGPSFRYESGTAIVDFGRLTRDGGVETTSTVDHNHGVVSRFDPPVPGPKAGMTAGEIIERDIGVKVYDLTNPTKQEHAGHLHVTLTYIGAYQVTVPAGDFRAAQVGFQGQGGTGPLRGVPESAVVPGSGPVAMIDKRDVSAVLV